MPTLRHDIGWLVPVHTEHISRAAPIGGTHLLGQLITTWLLMNQQMTETTPAKLPRAIRNAYQRSQRPAPDVRLVRIRPPSTPVTDPPPTPTSERRRSTPDYRYWVSGHERNQAYGPGRSLRKKIDVEPFLKGPDDKPIKLSTTVRVLGRRKPQPPDADTPQ